MKQVLLSRKGEIEVWDVPIPVRVPGSVLVKNAFSLVSTGTERSAISGHGGWLAVVEKAMKSQDRVQQVWELAHTQGVVKTWKLVRDKLDEYIMPGYSCAGRIVEVSDDNLPYHPGDLVACMGAGFATHSEYAVVPTNLVAPIPEGVGCTEAAFGAVGCIAMQGVRRLELRPGEWVGVLGLGLIGQVAAQLLTVMGYRAVGMDLLCERAAKARDLTGIEAWGVDDVDSVGRVNGLTDGRGLDGVIVCAATESDEPINLAFDLCRERGRVSLVGDVGLDLARDRMYKKELDLRMSRSYGPGRYDDAYEVRGQDYPLAYVRWTEQRNLEYFLYLLKERALQLAPLMSLRCPVEEAPDGYARLKQGGADMYGVLIDYGPLPEAPEPIGVEQRVVRSSTTGRKVSSDVIRLGIIGCGSFAKAVHLPNLRQTSDLFEIVGVASRTGVTARTVASQFGIPVATSDYRTLLDDSSVDAVLIATRHASHAHIVLDALEAGKHVLVEKPMCLTIGEGKRIVARADESGLVVRVGFNRRFSPYLNAMGKAIGEQGRRMLFCRVNVGSLHDDWSTTADQGGRLLGEGVHFFDLCNWFMREEPVSLSAVIAGEIVQTNPNVMIQIQYPDGCVAQVLYTTLGHKGAGKEYFEAFGNGRAVSSEDYKTLDAFGVRASTHRRNRGDKGHLSELKEFASVIQGKKYPIEGADARAGLVATWMALAAYESAVRGDHIRLVI